MLALSTVQHARAEGTSQRLGQLLGSGRAHPTPSSKRKRVSRTSEGVVAQARPEQILFKPAGQVSAVLQREHDILKPGRPLHQLQMAIAVGPQCDLSQPSTHLVDRDERVRLLVRIGPDHDRHLGYDKHDPAGRNGQNSRNGTRAKTVLTEIGPVGIDVPRDRGVLRLT
jgi:hypothetical protein